MKLSSNQKIGAGLVAAAVILFLWKKKQTGQNPFDPNALGWGQYIPNDPGDPGSGGLITAGISY